MVRKPKVNPVPKNIQKQTESLGKRLGFKSDYEYRQWVKRFSSLPESDPRYFRKDLRGHAREAEIKRIRKIHARTLTPAEEIQRKANVLVYQAKKWSAFAFMDKYLEQINQLLQDPNVQAQQKEMLQDLLKELQEDIDAEDPNDMGRLF